MANKTLTISMDKRDAAQINALFQGIIEGLEDMTPFWDAVEMHMIDSLTMNFEQEGRPIKWEPLAEWTIEEKGSSVILQDSGNLKASVNASNTQRSGDTLDIWAGEVHGLFHQYVDQDPMAQFGIMNKNKKHPMPMRPFMLFQDEDLDAIQEIGYNYLVEISGG